MWCESTTLASRNLKIESCHIKQDTHMQRIMLREHKARPPHGKWRVDNTTRTMIPNCALG